MWKIKTFKYTDWAKYANSHQLYNIKINDTEIMRDFW